MKAHLRRSMILGALLALFAYLLCASDSIVYYSLANMSK